MSGDENLYPAVTPSAPTLQDALLAGLAASANDLRTVANDLYRSALLSKIEKTVVAIIIVASLVTSTVSLVLLFQLHGIASTNKTNNAATRQNTAIIRECTDPSGTCYQQNAARTAVLVAQLQSAMVIAIECADEVNGREAINSCIADRLKK